MGEATPSPPYKIMEQPLGTARKIRIITIGAGASGLNMIRTLRLTLPKNSYTHVVYEKNLKIGGTWYENRYPGCKCDIPAHNYQFSWKQNPGWSEFLAKQEEIEGYLGRVCEEEGLGGEIDFGKRVVEARWDGDEGLWKVKVEVLGTGKFFDDTCHFLLDASGILK